MTRNEYLFIERARYFSNPAYSQLFCDLVKNALERCDIPIDSKSYSITVRKEDHQGISFNLNTRLICSIWKKKGNDIIAMIINEEDVIKHGDKEAFIESGNYLFKNHRSTHIYFDLEKLIKEDNQSLYEDFYKSAQDGYISNHKSPFHRHNMPDVYDIIVDDSKRNEIFNIIESDQDLFKILIEKVLKKRRIQEIIKLPTFYYRKAQEIFNEFNSQAVTVQEMDEIIEEYKEYEGGDYYEYVASLPQNDKKDFADIMGSLIAHIDYHAAGKNKWNKLEDKRVVANSLVRQNEWIKSLITFKKSEGDLNVVQSHSIRCGIELLIHPDQGISMLSNGHREKILQFLFSKSYDESNTEDFIVQLKNYFEPFNLQLANEDNLTCVISSCLYHKEVEGIWNYKEEANNKFESLGKRKQKKYQDLFDKYKEKVNQGGFIKEEVYKFEAIQHFQKTFNIEAEDFGKNLIDALKKDTNLRYQNSQNFIKGLTTHFSEDTRTLFRILVNIKDELKEGELSKLFSTFSNQAAGYEEQVKNAMGKDKLSHTQDERSLSTYLTFLYPDRFCFYMNGVYQSFAEYVVEDTKKAGKKYEHFLTLLEPLQDLILQDEELVEMVRAELSNSSYQGDLTAAISQDIVYQLLKQGKMNFSIEEMKQMFVEYLDRVIPKSARNYLSAVPTVDRIAKKANLINESIYELQEIESFRSFLSKIDNNEQYKERNNVGHNMFQSALKKYKDFLIELNNEAPYEMETIKTLQHPLNIIMYGPPGTGKTYVSKSKAVEIIDGFVTDDRALINARYNELVEAGNILFVTFHQSTGYEDFIEGIKPDLANEEEDQIKYHIEDGIFKRICVQASFEYLKNYNQGGLAAKSLEFSELYEEYIAFVDDRLVEDGDFELTLKSGKDIKVVEITPRGNIKLQHVGGKREYVVSKERLEKLYYSIDDLNAISNINTTFRSIIGGSNTSAYWAIFDQINALKSTGKQPMETVFISYQDKLKAFQKIKWEELDTKLEVPKYVLIIDEINRGNVAMILGELITLLEEDKRGGKKEFLNAILPYSKMKFSVPPNIYVIGTMNTADRSVEALDSALRRRFTFIEVPPDPNVIEQPENFDVDLNRLLTAINQRIEILLDKDHRVGHSYFMSISESNDPEEALKTVFAYKVIPLLEEYFYGDLSKVGLILGDEFVVQRENINDDIWAKGDFEKPDPPESSKFFLIYKELWTLESFKSIYE